MPTFKKQSFGIVIGLVIQYLLGMYINMYVSFPEEGTADQLWQFANSQPAVVAHMLIGLLLLINSLWLLIRVFKAKDLIWKKAGGESLFATVLRNRILPH